MKPIYFVSKILIILLACFLSAHAAEENFSEFERIMSGIQENCYECLGSTEERLREFVNELEELVNSGFETLQARKLLADSYYQIAIVYTSRSSPERTELLRRYEELYTQLINDFPENVDVALEFARTTENQELVESVRIRLERMYAEANYLAGSLLRTSEQPEELELGLTRLREAYRVSSSLNKVNYGRKLIEELTKSNLQSEAESIQEDLNDYRREVGL